MAGGGEDDVAAALAILRDAGFPIERIRIVPATPAGEGAVADDGPPLDRNALLSACLAILRDGGSHAAKDLARDLRAQFPGLTRKHVNSVLSVEGKGDVAYDRTTFMYRLGVAESE